MRHTAPLPLNLIGPGRLGQSVARLLAAQGDVTIGQIAGRNAQRVDAARDFIGGGELATLETLRPAALTLMAVPDDALPALVDVMLTAAPLRAGDIVFHCSGALPSAVLAPLRARGVWVASIHPLKSFAQPALAVGSFAGTWCGCEGDAAALAVLLPLFEGLGARCFAIDPDGKTLYHAGAVLACNTLVALMEAALRCMEGAGVPREAAWPALLPLIQGTLANVGRLGTAEALTGPVVRGDLSTVQRQVEVTQALSPAICAIYRALSTMATELAAPGLSPQTALALADLLQAPTNVAEADKLAPSSSPAEDD